MGTIQFNSGLDPTTMSVLATTNTQKLLWDYSNSQNFFVFTPGPPKLLQQTSPMNAFNFYANAGVINVYNPFLFNAYLSSPSSQV